MERPDAAQLEQAFEAHQGLWPSFTMQFANALHREVPRLLRRLSPWHLSLSLAAGQIAGKEASNDGKQTLLVKGGTQKVQRTVTSIRPSPPRSTNSNRSFGLELTSGESFG
ncbi:hypothetical protein [Vibrio parahaemolyticus]|uniref:hypothetical protein n=1 Tax=Vibrio parahaemolyticus TaxID=670 RepID=UPI001F5B0530|nr:hypothetical protein [Vibrio parahaemolyticus]